MTCGRGFTLVEVLVALGMVAVALAAGVALQSSLQLRAEREPITLLAEVCARNRFTELRLLQKLPAAGQERSRCEQAGRALEVLTTITQTASPDLQQVRVRVLLSDPGGHGESVLLSLASVLGRY